MSLEVLFSETPFSKSEYEVYASHRHVQLFRMLKPEEKLIDRTYSEIICCAEIV